MGQHGARGDVADGIDAGHARAQRAVHAHAAGLGVGFDPRLRQPQPLGERPAADAHQQPVELEGLGGLGGFDLNRHPVLGRPGALDLGPQAEGEPLLLEKDLQPAADLAVHGGDDVRQHFDHGDLGAQPQPDRTELEADVAPAHDAEGRRHGVEVEGLGGADDELAVERRRGDLDARAAGGQDDVFGLEGPGGLAGDLHPVGARQPGVPWTTSILWLSRSLRTPSVRSLTTRSLRAISWPRSRRSSPVWIPWSANRALARWKYSLESSRALLGMQPTLRHTPPRRGRRSTQAVFSPSWAARTAAT